MERLGYFAYTVVFALIGAVGASGVPILTSNVEVINGKHITVPGAEVVFTCQVTDSFGLIWSAPPHLNKTGNLRYTQSDVIGDSRTDGPFVGNITSKSADELGHINITTTLTFEAQEQFSLLGIICSNTISDETITNATATLYFSTTRLLKLTTLNTDSSTVCPNQNVTLVCEAIDASYVEWIVDALALPFQFTAMSNSGTTITDQGFVGKLINISPSDNAELANITITLNFLASSETFVQCSSDKGDVFNAVSSSCQSVNSSAGGLSAGAKAGIAIAVVLVVGTVLIILLLCFMWRREMALQATPLDIKSLAVSDITETSALVTWKIKGVRSESDCVLTLTVKYMDGSPAQEHYPTGNQNRYLLKGLIPLVQYQVYLSATNEKGESSRKGPEIFTTKCGAEVSLFTTPYLATLTWKPPPQYRDECPDEILLTVHNYNESAHEKFKVPNTETVKTVQVEPSTQYYVSWTVTHKGEPTKSEKKPIVLPTPDPLPECAQTFIHLTEAVPYYVWQEQGITVELQSNSLPDGVDKCPVKIKVFLPNCSELFPHNNDTVSPVVHLATPVVLMKPLKVTVVHCGGSGVRVASGENPINAPSKFITDASMKVTESSQTATVYCPPPESCFVVVSESKSNTAFCAHVYYDDQKGDLYMTLAKNIPVYTKILDDHASEKCLQKVQEIPELSFIDGRDVMTVYQGAAMMKAEVLLAKFHRDMASYFTDTSICVIQGCFKNQPRFSLEVNFDMTKKVWVYFSTLNQQIENQEMIARDAITLKALHDSNDILELQQSWREFATNLGVGMRIASLGHTYQGRASSDRLCAFEVIVQWMRCHPHPTYEALKAAINLSTERQRSSIVNENTESLQSTQAGAVVVMEDVDGLLEKYKYLSTDWDLLAVALGLGAYIGFISEKEKSVRVRALFQLWTTLEKESATWSKLTKGVAIAGIQ